MDRRYAQAILFLGAVSSVSAILYVNHYLNELPRRPAAIVDAARRGDEAAVTSLLDAGVSPDARDPAGATPLAMAAQQDRIRVVNLLLRRGAHADGAALLLAVKNARTDVVAALLDQGLDVNRNYEIGIGGARQRETPLRAAVLSPGSEAVAFLLRRGADPNARCTDAPCFPGETPLHRAMLNGNLRAASLLLAAGADVEAKLCRETGPVRAPSGPQIDSRSARNPYAGYTPLLIAVRLGDARMVDLLLRYGARATSRGADGKNALELASGSESVRAVLRGASRRPSTGPHRERQPSDRAPSSGLSITASGDAGPAGSHP